MVRMPRSGPRLHLERPRLVGAHHLIARANGRWRKPGARRRGRARSDANRWRTGPDASTDRMRATGPPSPCANVRLRTSPARNARGWRRCVTAALMSARRLTGQRSRPTPPRHESDHPFRDVVEPCAGSSAASGATISSGVGPAVAVAAVFAVLAAVLNGVLVGSLKPAVDKLIIAHGHNWDWVILPAAAGGAEPGPRRALIGQSMLVNRDRQRRRRRHPAPAVRQASCAPTWPGCAPPTPAASSPQVLYRRGPDPRGGHHRRGQLRPERPDARRRAGR